MTIKSGKEYLMESLMGQLMRYLPPETVDNIQQIANTVMGAKEQMDRIEAKLDALLNARSEIERSNGITTHFQREQLPGE